MELLLEGYDHILDAEDDKMNIVDVATQRDHEATVQFLQSIPNYVVNENTQFERLCAFFFKYIDTWAHRYVNNTIHTHI